jgi:hypothetical protein
VSSRPRSRVLRTSGSPVTAAAPTRPGMRDRSLQSLLASRAQCWCLIPARAPGACSCLTSIPSALAVMLTPLLSSTIFKHDTGRAAEVRARVPLRRLGPRRRLAKRPPPRRLRPVRRSRPSGYGALDRSGGPLGLAPGSPVMIPRPGWLMPGLRWIVADPPLLSTMRYGTGRLRYVVPDREPARRLRIRLRAGEDADRPLPSIHLGGVLGQKRQRPGTRPGHLTTTAHRWFEIPLLVGALTDPEPKPRRAQHPWPR